VIAFGGGSGLDLGKMVAFGRQSARRMGFKRESWAIGGRAGCRGTPCAPIIARTQPTPVQGPKWAAQSVLTNSKPNRQKGSSSTPKRLPSMS